MRAIPVANHLLRVAFREKAEDFTPLKMQKMLYFLHGWYLAVTGESLVDRGFEKWQYGPVSPPIYDALRKYGSSPVNDYIREFDTEAQEVTAYFVNTDVKPEFESILERVWAEYSPFSGTQLSTLTHKPNTPWSMTNDRQQIDDAVIREHFVEVARSKHESVFS